MTPAEHPNSRTAKLSAGVGSTRSKTKDLVPLPASTSATRRTNSSEPWRVSAAKCHCWILKTCVQIISQALCSLAHCVSVHAIGTYAQLSTKATRTERKIAIECILHTLGITSPREQCGWPRQHWRASARKACQCLDSSRMLTPLRGQHHAHGLNNQLEITPHGALLDVEQIQVDPLVEQVIESRLRRVCQ